MNKISLLAAAITNPCDKGYVGTDSCPSGGNETDLLNLAGDITTWLTIAIGILSVLFIIISAFQIMTSGGDPEKVKKGRRTLLYSIIGLAVAILASVIVNIVFNIADSI